MTKFKVLDLPTGTYYGFIQPNSNNLTDYPEDSSNFNKLLWERRLTDVGDISYQDWVLEKIVTDWTTRHYYKVIKEHLEPVYDLELNT